MNLLSKDCGGYGMIKLLSDMLDTAVTEGLISTVLSLYDKYEEKIKKYLGVEEKGE